MTVVLLDTNCLMMPHQHGVDVFAEIERLVPEAHTVATLSTVLSELKDIVSSSQDGVAAKVGLVLLADRGVSVIPSTGPVDDALVAYAVRERAFVCTNDRGLRSRLKVAGVKVIAMRGRNRLAWV